MYYLIVNCKNYITYFFIRRTQCRYYFNLIFYQKKHYIIYIKNHSLIILNFFKLFEIKIFFIVLKLIEIVPINIYWVWSSFPFKYLFFISHWTFKIFLFINGRNDILSFVLGIDKLQFSFPSLYFECAFKIWGYFDRT